ncbi:MAG: hypothetical protein IKS55_02535 [Oscillospiraceae bacterium]|nr:hypothetical protein [Oscillospiraceae bacterium]
MGGIYIHNFTKERYEELLMWARVGANNCMIGEHTEITVVPDHGRLIDADVLVRELNSIRVSFGSTNGLVEGGLNIAVSTVNGMPTIIPADKEVDNG